MDTEPQAVQPGVDPDAPAPAPAQPGITQVASASAPPEQPVVATAATLAASSEAPAAADEGAEASAPAPPAGATKVSAELVPAVPPAPPEPEPDPDPDGDIFADDDEEEEEQPVLMSFGVTDMDKRLGGGIPLESLTLVEGDPESGKSVVIQQLAHGALKEGLKVSIFLSEQSVREFLNQMEDLGMEVIDHYLVGRLWLYQADLRVDQERAERLMKRLIKFMEKSEDSDIVIVDSITSLLFQFDARYVLSFLATCRDIAATGKTIVVTLHSYAINESLRLRAGSIVDAHLRLSIEELGAQVVRTMEVSKIRGAVKTIGNTVSFNVEQGLGLKSIPISKTKG